MKRLLVAVAMVFVLGWTCIAQTSDADSPATRDDIQRYLQVTRSHDMLNKVAIAMSQGLTQMFHEQYLKHKDELPPDYEAKMTERMNNMFENMPWDEMMDAMVPVYQRHFTRGDIDNLVGFYSSPTGEKLLREMPSIMADSMQAATPIMMKYMETVQKRLQKETDVMIAQSKKNANPNPPSAHN